MSETSHRATERRGAPALRPLRLRPCIRVLAALVVAARAASGAQEPPAPAAEPSIQQQILQRREAVRGDLAQAQARAAPTENAAAPGRLRSEIELLERIDLLLGRQLAARSRELQLRAASDEPADTLARLEATGPAEPPPYSFVALEAARDELAAGIARVERATAAVDAARAALARARGAYDEAERARRAAIDEQDRNTDPGRAAEVAAGARLARLESRAAGETVRLRERELAVEIANEALAAVQRDIAAARVEWMEQGTQFSAADFREIGANLAATEQSLRRDLVAAEEEARLLELRLLDARVRLEAAGADDPAAAEELEARRLAHDVARRRALSLSLKLEWNGTTETAWERRFKIANDRAEPAAISEWATDAAAAIAALDVAGRLQSADLADARTRLATVQAQRAEVEGPAVQWLAEQQSALEALHALIESNIAAIDEARRVQARLLDDIRRARDDVPISERLGAVWRGAKAVWSYEIASIDDRPITVGKITFALLLLIAGVLLSRRLSVLLGRRLLRRFRLTEGAAGTIQSLAFYVLILIFGLVALRLANVPMTAFTILGGALAIGAGFGSQTIIKNFLSGLVLIAERPIRVGDLVQIGDLYGTVEHIGARATRVRTGDNVEIVVPNGAFLEQNVINWTLSETRVRISVKVGVVYGSPTREVVRLMTRAAEEHGRVLKQPPPLVLFNDFGDNSLNFEVIFWVHMRSVMDRRIVESDVRFRIDSLFREADIVIAFPQRDVHLDSARPVEVRVVSDDEQAPVRAEGPNDAEPGRAVP